MIFIQQFKTFHTTRRVNKPQTTQTAFSKKKNMFSLDWPHRASPSSRACNKSKTTTASTTSRKPLGSITNHQRKTSSNNHCCMALHKAPPLKTIKVLSRLKFNKKGHRTKEEIKNTTFQENNICSISKFIKSNFSDKMTYMLQREFKARAIEKREKDPKIIESNLLKNAQKILHTSIFGQRQQQQQHHLNTKDDSKQQQQKHQLFQQKKWGDHAASNLHLYEEEEDNKRNNEKQRIGHPLYQCKQKYNQHKYKEAHVHAKEFISICQENEKEMAFRQNVITLRALAHDGDGDDTTHPNANEMKLKEAQNLFNYDVIEPKIYHKEERGLRIRDGNNNSLCARCGCNSSSVSYCDLNAPYLSNKNKKEWKEDEEIEMRRWRRRRRKRSQMKRNELRKEREKQVSIVRRAVVQSCQKLKK